MSNAVEIDGLRKVYRTLRRSVVAVDHLQLEVPSGGVFGFLGPNGSGKTSTIRAIVGIMRRFDGSVRVLGAEAPRGLDGVIDRIGALVETPSFFPAFSGARNLSLLARARDLPRHRVHAVLESVGLTARADDPVKGYSLGMRQRLGLAAALLKDPELLVLDEPANGLDPDGMRQMRRSLRRLGDEGRTVFVSSHLLAEVSQLCDRVAVLRKGRCVFSGPIDELTGRASGVRLRVHGGPEATARAVALLADADVDASRGADGELVVVADPAAAWEIVRRLAHHELWANEIGPVTRSLEDGYVELVHGDDRNEPEKLW